MRKITGKEFKQTLIDNESLRVLCERNSVRPLSTIIKLLLDAYPFSEYRHVIKVQTNAIQFSNKSWLYFDQKVKSKTYYRYKDHIILYEEYDNNQSLCLIYHIKGEK